MKRKLLLSSAALLLALTLIASLSGVVQAHGKTTAGDYDLEIGFHNEPAYVGEPNSLDLFITNSKTGKAVNGQESTLKAEIIFGSNKKSFAISPQDGVDGGYTAAVIPTAVGDYTWHIFGTIESTPVDVSMTSSPDTFVSVTAKTDDMFPTAGSSSAQPSPVGLIAGIAGVVLGLAGLVVGLMALQAAHRRPS